MILKISVLIRLKKWLNQLIIVKIKNELFKRPNEKYQFPLTQSQEIGWDICPNLNTGKRRYKKTCDVTRYADDYYTLKGVNPFVTKSISKGEATEIAK